MSGHYKLEHYGDSGKLIRVECIPAEASYEFSLRPWHEPMLVCGYRLIYVPPEEEDQ